VIHEDIQTAKRKSGSIILKTAKHTPERTNPRRIAIISSLTGDMGLCQERPPVSDFTGGMCVNPLVEARVIGRIAS
jgi:hypothetical protein